MRPRRLGNFGLIVAGALAFALALPAAAEPSQPRWLLPEPMAGTAALDAVGKRLPEVAQLNGVTTRQLLRLLERDQNAWLDRTGRLLFKDTHVPVAASGEPAEAAPYPNEQTFLLHSRPTASRTIHLDFDGHVVEGTAWNNFSSFGSGVQPAFDIDGDPASWGQAEHDVVQSVFRRVAEDFSPFNVDVTTEDPGVAGLHRDSESDEVFGTRVLITPSQEAHDALCGGCGGVAFVGNYDDVGSNTYWQPAWVFAQYMGGNAKYIAEAASHEAGHNLGLMHHGTSSLSYYEGHHNWAPIMGVGYYRPLVQWSNGEYADANNAEQDDIELIQENGLPLRPDDHRDTLRRPTTFRPGGAMAGTIGIRSDIDVFSIIRRCSGPATVWLDVAPDSPNLDARLRLLTPSGTVLAEDDPASGTSHYDLATGLSASITASLQPGRYVVEVDGVGVHDETRGYSDYASLGDYTLTVSACD